jgi:translation elongation factor EF-G
LSRPQTSAAAKPKDDEAPKEELLINLISPCAGGLFHQLAWMADGAVVVVDPFSGLSHETAQLLRLLATGGIKPILFIDHLDLALQSDASAEEIYQTLLFIVTSVNDTLSSCPNGSLVSPTVSVGEGSVVFGSLHWDWAFTIKQFLTQCCQVNLFGATSIGPITNLWV